MRILIVGGNSSVGKALIPVLAGFADVVTAGRRRCEIEMDLTWEESKIRIPEDIDAVIITVSEFGGTSVQEMSLTFEVNVLGTLKICQAAKAAKAGSIVFISSMFSMLSQDSQAFGAYALSKRHAEDVCSMCCKMWDLPLTILRPSQLYGIGENFRVHQPFLFKMMDLAVNGKDIILHGTGSAKRNFMHVDDLAQIIALVIKKEVRGTYSCMNPNDFTYSQIAQMVLKAFKGQGQVLFQKEMPNVEDQVFPADNTLYDEIGFFPQVTMEAGLEKIAVERRASF